MRGSGLRGSFMAREVIHGQMEEDMWATGKQTSVTARVLKCIRAGTVMRGVGARGGFTARAPSGGQMERLTWAGGKQIGVMGWV
jgi:hypothetical protein